MNQDPEGGLFLAKECAIILSWHDLSLLFIPCYLRMRWNATERCLSTRTSIPCERLCSLTSYCRWKLIKEMWCLLSQYSTARFETSKVASVPRKSLRLKVRVGEDFTLEINRSELTWLPADGALILVGALPLASDQGLISSRSCRMVKTPRLQDSKTR